MSTLLFMLMYVDGTVTNGTSKSYLKNSDHCEEVIQTHQPLRHYCICLWKVESQLFDFIIEVEDGIFRTECTFCFQGESLSTFFLGSRSFISFVPCTGRNICRDKPKSKRNKVLFVDGVDPTEKLNGFTSRCINPVVCKSFRA